MSDVHDLSGRHIAFFSWRDTHNPEGGGAERYLEKMADGLVGPRRPGHHLLRGPRRGPARRDRRRRALRAARHQAERLQRGVSALVRGELGRVDVVVDVQNGLPVLHPRRHPEAGHRAGAPRAPRAVAGRLPGPQRPGRLVDRAQPRPAPLPRLPVRRRLAGHPRRAGRPRRRPRAHRRRAQRHRPGHPGRRRQGAAPHDRGRRPPGPAQAGRARHRRGARACGRATPTCGCTSSAAAGGRPSSTRTPTARGAGDTVVFEGHVDERRKHEVYEQAWLLAPALAQGGVGPGDRRGRHAPDPDRGLPLGGRHARVGRRRPLGSARRRRGRRSPRRSVAWSTTTRSGPGSARGRTR